MRAASAYVELRPPSSYYGATGRDRRAIWTPIVTGFYPRSSVKSAEAATNVTVDPVFADGHHGGEHFQICHIFIIAGHGGGNLESSLERLKK